MFCKYRKAKHDISISLLLFTVLFIRWNNKIEFNKPFHRQNEYCLSLSLQSRTGRVCAIGGHTRVGTLIVATIYLQLIQNRYMFRSFTVLQCSHQHCVQPVASDVEVVGYL